MPETLRESFIRRFFTTTESDKDFTEPVIEMFLRFLADLEQNLDELSP
jgi:hypothetical protein